MIRYTLQTSGVGIIDLLLEFDAVSAGTPWQASSGPASGSALRPAFRGEL
jgi:hypothetical protein